MRITCKKRICAPPRKEGKPTKPVDGNDEAQELNDEVLDGIAGGAGQEDGCDDPREHDHGNKKDDPKDA